MCDIEKYEKIYKEIEKLQPEDTMQLVLESKTEDEKNFNENVPKWFKEKVLG